MATTTLSRTMGTPTLGTKFTYSVWVKREGFAVSSGGARTIASMWQDGNNHIVLRFDAQDNLSFYVQFAPPADGIGNRYCLQALFFRRDISLLLRNMMSLNRKKDIFSKLNGYYFVP